MKISKAYYVPIHNDKGAVVHTATIFPAKCCFTQLAETFPNCYIKTTRETIPLDYLHHVKNFNRKWI